MNNVRFFVIVGVVALMLVSCGDRFDDVNESPIVAEAAGATLHLNELNLFIMDNPGLDISKVQVSNYIQRWSEKELVYRQAVSENFQKHPDIQKKIDDLVKDFVVAAYLHDQIDSKVKVSDSDIRNYYNDKAAEEFIRQQDFYDVSVILVSTYSEAIQVRQRLQDGEEFETLAKENSLDASKDAGGKLGWILLDEFPQEVARKIRSQSVDVVSTPVKTSLGYFLVLVHGVRKAGETQTLEEVRDLVEWRIRAKRRDDDYKELIKQLKEREDVTINWNYLDSLNWERK